MRPDDTGTLQVGHQVSVIVPAFNAQPYIRDCIESLFRQRVSLQIVVVDDGSTDGTADVIHSLRIPEPHSLVTIRQTNSGLSAARNLGMRLATAPYLGFVDADDWVHPEMFSAMLAAAESGSAELVVCGGQMIDHDTAEAYPFQDAGLLRELASTTAGTVSPRSDPRLFRLDTSACRRLYSRVLLQKCGFSFAEGLLFEDVLAHYQLLLAARSVRVLDDNLYSYRVNHPGRITDRRDRSVLTVFGVLSLVVHTLTDEDASDDVWSAFLWLQDWVLRWLVTQLDEPHREEFAEQAVLLARAFPPSAVTLFQRLSDGDLTAQRAVELQLLGDSARYLQNALATSHA